MNAVEKLLRQGIEADLADFSLRLELAEKLAARDAREEMSQLIDDAPIAPDSAAEMHRFLELAAQCRVGDEVVNRFAAKYVEAQPADAWGHHVYALGLSRIGEDEQARRHFDAAQKLNPETRDPELEAALAAEEGEEVLAPHPMTAPVSVRAPGNEELTEAEVEAVLAEISEDSEPPAAVPVAMAVALEIAEDDSVAETETIETETQSATAVPVARSLKSPGQRDRESNDEADASGSAQIAAPESLPAETTSNVDVAPPGDGDEVGGGDPDLEGEHHDRAFIVGEGEMIHAKEKESDTKEKISALTVALAVNVGLILLASIWAIASPPKDPPSVIASHIADLDSEEIEVVQVEKRIRRPPAQSASAQVEVMTVAGASSVSIPEITVDTESFEPIGVGDSFGMSMSFDSGEDGGMVSFFGARATSKKVVFVVDYSASMRGDKDKLMRKELKKSIEALPASVEYALIMFSGPPWYAGQTHDPKGDPKDKWANDYVRDGSKEWKWYGGWDESKRVKQGGRALVVHYEDDDPEKLPPGKYMKATRSNIRKTLKDVEDTPLSGGTDWRAPLMMAMNMEPDTIYFMTDGAIPGSNAQQNAKMIDDLVKYNRAKSRAKINTICMMVLKAKKELEDLAQGTRGEFSLVKQDGSVVRGRDL